MSEYFHQFCTAIEALDLGELIKIRDFLMETITNRKMEQITTFHARAEALKQEASELGIALFKTRSRSIGPPKYRNPADKNDTWTGKGKKPRWVESHLNQGLDIDQLLIESNAEQSAT